MYSDKLNEKNENEMKWKQNRFHANLFSTEHLHAIRNAKNLKRQNNKINWERN